MRRNLALELVAGCYWSDGSQNNEYCSMFNVDIKLTPQGLERVDEVSALENTYYITFILFGCICMLHNSVQYTVLIFYI